MPTTSRGWPVDPRRLPGLVDVRARIEDPRSFEGWLTGFPHLQTAHHPARVRLAVTRLADGTKVIAHGRLWLRLFARPDGPYWDTTRIANGR